MPALRPAAEQIIGTLKEQEAGAKTADVCATPKFRLMPM
jgi:hypothetical protein